MFLHQMENQKFIWKMVFVKQFSFLKIDSTAFKKNSAFERQNSISIQFIVGDNRWTIDYPYHWNLYWSRKFFSIRMCSEMGVTELKCHPTMCFMALIKRIADNVQNMCRALVWNISS